MPLTLALSVLCENPRRRTGLSTFFHEFVRHGLRVAPDVRWIVFASRAQAWSVIDDRVAVVSDFPSNEHRLARLRADHFGVASAARRRGAHALLTVGFVPLCAAGLPVVMHVFSARHRRETGLGAWYRSAVVGRGLRRAAMIIVNSQWAATQLGAALGPVIVSYEGLQRERFVPTGSRGRPDLPPEYLLWVGNFYAYKRAELALAAYARLAPELRRRFPLVLAGGDWEGGRSRAEEFARRLQIERDTRFIGWVGDDELPALYRGARAHVLSTSEETFGRSVTEAMACGCPCVLQDLPVLREVTADAARLVDFGNAEAAAGALAQICMDDALAAQLRAVGLRRAEIFSFEKLAHERLAAIRALLERAR